MSAKPQNVREKHINNYAVHVGTIMMYVYMYLWPVKSFIPRLEHSFAWAFFGFVQTLKLFCVNLLVQATDVSKRSIHQIHYLTGSKILFLTSSCIYMHADIAWPVQDILYVHMHILWQSVLWSMHTRSRGWLIYTGTKLSTDYRSNCLVPIEYCWILGMIVVMLTVTAVVVMGHGTRSIYNSAGLFQLMHTTNHYYN